VSNRGVVPLSWTLDHVGALCRSVGDTAIMLSVIAGYDELDPSSVEMPVPDYSNALEVQVSKLRLAFHEPFSSREWTRRSARPWTMPLCVGHSSHAALLDNPRTACPVADVASKEGGEFFSDGRKLFTAASNLEKIERHDRINQATHDECGRPTLPWDYFLTTRQPKIEAFLVNRHLTVQCRCVTGALMRGLTT
jgi:hypothetical protein